MLPPFLLTWHTRAGVSRFEFPMLHSILSVMYLLFYSEAVRYPRLFYFAVHTVQMYIYSIYITTTTNDESHGSLSNRVLRY